MPEIFIRLDVGYPQHPKSLAIQASLRQGAHWNVVDLWAWAAINRPDGRLRGLTDRQVAANANWSGSPSKFVAALLHVPPGEACGFAFRDGEVLVLYHWQERQQYFVREEVRAYERLKKRGQRGKHPSDVPDNHGDMSGTLSGTSPGLSPPQSEKEKVLEREISPLPPSGGSGHPGLPSAVAGSQAPSPPEPAKGGEGGYSRGGTADVQPATPGGIVSHPRVQVLTRQFEGVATPTLREIARGPTAGANGHSVAAAKLVLTRRSHAETHPPAPSTAPNAAGPAGAVDLRALSAIRPEGKPVRPRDRHGGLASLSEIAGSLTAQTDKPQEE